MEPKTEPRSELLVFNRKEVAVIIILLVLVALFSFTLGLRLGRTLGVTKSEHVESAPPLSTEPQHHGEAHAIDPQKASGHATGHDLAAPHAEATVSEKKAVKDQDEAEPAERAEDKADLEFVNEVSKEKPGLSKALPLSLPNEKKSEIRSTSSVGYTLQVGSHRTVAEAAEQVSGLKKSGFDAFYLEAKVPGRGTWYRVGIGFYPNKEAAERAASKYKLGSKPMPSFIVQKINE